MSARVVIVGAGPAGLMAAEVLAAAGLTVDVFDAMPSPARKLLRAGVGGLNLTHAEAADAFLSRFGAEATTLAPWLARFDAAAVRAWAEGLGVETFVGSSGRVFPVGMKAAPLLRAWRARLLDLGVRLHLRERWQGGLSADGDGFVLDFDGPHGAHQERAAAVVLALGGASWPRLGADGEWPAWLAAHGVTCAPWQPANCGFELAAPWSEHFRQRFVRTPLKAVRARWQTADGGMHERAGELLLTEWGIEGGLVYAAARDLRERIAAHGSATLWLDLVPARSEAQLAQALGRARGKRSFAWHLKNATGVDGARAALLREGPPADGFAFDDADRLAARLKALPIVLARPRPLAEAISSAGGVLLTEINPQIMLRRLPGVFCCGEMLNWEAPTGGYLLTACLASGRVAGEGVLAWLER